MVSQRENKAECAADEEEDSEEVFTHRSMIHTRRVSCLNPTLIKHRPVQIVLIFLFCLFLLGLFCVDASFAVSDNARGN